MPRLNGSGSQSILIHASSTSAIATTSTSSTTMDERLNRSGSSLIVGAGNQNHNCNTSIVSERPPPIRKVPLKTSSSFSASPLTSRFLQQSDSAPILPDRMPDSSSNNNNSSNHIGAASSLAAAAKRRLSQFRASEKGKGDVLPMHHAHAISSSPIRPRTQSQGSFNISISSTPIVSSSSASASASASSCGSIGSGDGGVGVGSEPQRSLRSRRKTSMRVQQQQQPPPPPQQQHQSHSQQQFDEIDNTSENNTYDPRSSWSDESDSGNHINIHNQNAQQQQQQMYHAQHSQHQHSQNHNHNHSNSYTHTHTTSSTSPTSCLQQSQHHHSPQKQKHYPLQREASSHVMGGMCGSGSRGFAGDNKRYYNSKSHLQHQHQQPLWLNMTPVQFITVMLLLAITCFVAGSYHKVLATTDVLKEVKHEESLLLLHLQRVEQASLQLHENLSRLNDRSSSTSSTNNQHENTNTASAGNSVLVDSDLIRIQTEKLREMEAELDHEVRALQKKIQMSARRSIVENYGEGAVQVYLDLQNPEGDEEGGEEEEQENGSLDSNSADAGGGGMNAKNRIAIRLWYDTPHSAWTFLSQVSSGQWDGAVIDWNVAATGGRSIAARSTNAGLGEHQGKPGATMEPELHFVEQSERGHERYTIGLQSEGTGLFINLQDNRDFYKSEPCVGTIINGFDVLHRVIRAAQKRSAAGNNNNGGSNPVRIKRARVSHVTTRA